jgi:RNA polymerase sigma-70 factor (ECF subfamily)
MPESDSSAASLVPTSSLLVRLRERDSEAWQRFLRLYGPLVYSWCRARWQVAPSDAADILQEVATRVLETLASFRGGNFVAWLEAITRSRVANFVKKNPTRAPGGSDALHLLAEVCDPRPGPAQGEDATSVAGGEPVASAPGWDHLGGVLHRAVALVRGRCARRSWQAFWQVAVDGRKPADVAADLGMTANAVYIAVSRIGHQLRAELGTLEKRPES